MSNQTFEIQSVLSLAAIFSLRMLGLFILLPIFSLSAHQLQGNTHELMGLALGIYGFTQAIFQIPLATLSDRIGRKPIIAFGLLIFVCGSLVAAFSTSITGVILGRALQGAGAIGSTIIALVADLTSLEHRSKAMAIVGMAIGLSFAIAIILGPILNTWIGLSGIFLLTALLGFIAILWLWLKIPEAPHTPSHKEPLSFECLKKILFNGELIRLNYGIFILHALLTALFIVIPLFISDLGIVASKQSWLVYLPGLLVAFSIVMPVIHWVEKHEKIKSAFITALFVLIAVQWFFWCFKMNILSFISILCVFFIAFTFLETMLPSLISKIAPKNWAVE